MDGFERRRQEKKDAILSAAWELFKKYGFNKVSVADIAKKASVSQVSIYNYFVSKENLKLQLQLNLWNRYYESLMSIFNGDESTKDKFERLLLKMIEHLRNYSADFMADALLDQLRDADETLAAQLGSINDALVSLFTQGKEEGAIRSDISVEAMLGYIDMFRFYIINSPDAALQYEKNPGMLKEMASLYLNALFEKPG